MEAGTGSHNMMSRDALARHTRAVRAIIRNPSTKGRRLKLYKAQLSNNRFAAKKARVY